MIIKIVILRNHFLKWQRKKAPVQTDAFEDGIDYISQLESASLQQDVAAAYESKVEAETVQSILNKRLNRHSSGSIQDVVFPVYRTDG